MEIRDDLKGSDCGASNRHRHTLRSRFGPTSKPKMPTPTSDQDIQARPAQKTMRIQAVISFVGCLKIAGCFHYQQYLKMHPAAYFQAFL